MKKSVYFVPNIKNPTCTYFFINIFSNIYYREPPVLGLCSRSQSSSYLDEFFSFISAHARFGWCSTRKSSSYLDQFFSFISPQRPVLCWSSTRKLPSQSSSYLDEFFSFISAQPTFLMIANYGGKFFSDRLTVFWEGLLYKFLR